MAAAVRKTNTQSYQSNRVDLRRAREQEEIKSGYGT